MSEEMTDKERAEAVLKKYDKDSDTMEYKGIMAKIVSAIAITFSIFQLYTATFGVLDAQLQRAVHLGFGLALVYLLYPTRKSWSRTKLHPFDLLLAILGATPVPKKLAAKLSESKHGGRVFSVLEPIALTALLLVVTAYLVDGSFNPFLYFRF